MADPADRLLHRRLEDDRCITYTVEHRVHRGATAAYLIAMERLMQAERRWPGYRDGQGPTLVQRAPLQNPASETADASNPGEAEDLWTNRIVWDDLESWLAWMDSEERRPILQEERHGGFSFRRRSNWQGYARWLGRAAAERTPIWKMNLIVLLLIYPTVMLVGRLTRDWSLQRPALMLIGNAITVAVTGWWLVPLTARAYAGWLDGHWSQSQRLRALVSILLLLLALLLLLFQALPAGLL
jgi:antibiotic biosynthesis monooxygenase (ABM) superfamily enzyme